MQLLLIYEEMTNRDKKKPLTGGYMAHKQFGLLPVVFDIAEDLLNTSEAYQRQVQPIYRYYGPNCHSFF